MNDPTTTPPPSDGAEAPPNPADLKPGPNHVEYMNTCHLHTQKAGEFFGTDEYGSIQRALSALRADINAMIEISILRIGLPKEEVFAFLVKSRKQEIQKIEQGIVNAYRGRIVQP